MNKFAYAYAFGREEPPELPDNWLDKLKNGPRVMFRGGILGSIGKVVGGVVGTLTGSDAAKKQEKAMREANAIAQQQADMAQQQINAANAKSPDIDTIKSDNASGLGSTMLTGTEGVTLGGSNKKKKTLLGG